MHDIVGLESLLDLKPIEKLFKQNVYLGLRWQKNPKSLLTALGESAMAKNRNKKKKLKNGTAPMDLSCDEPVFHVPQAMDTSECGAPRPPVGGPHRKMKGVQMKRTKNVRKMKAIAKAVSKHEQSEQKISKNESKIVRIQSAKKLYD